MTEFDVISVLFGILLGVAFGGVGAWILIQVGVIGTRREAERAAKALLEKSEVEAKAKAKDLELEAERKIAKRRESLDQDVERQQQETRDAERRLERRAEKLDARSEKVANKEEQVEALVVQRTSALKEVQNQF